MLTITILIFDIKKPLRFKEVFNSDIKVRKDYKSTL